MGQSNTDPASGHHMVMWYLKKYPKQPIKKAGSNKYPALECLIIYMN